MVNEILNVDVAKELYVEKITPIISGYVQSGQFTQRDVQIMQYTIEDFCTSLKAANLYFIQIEVAPQPQQPLLQTSPQPEPKTAPEAKARNVDLNAEEQKLRAEYFRKLRELEEADVTAQPEYVDEEPLPTPPLPPKEFLTVPLPPVPEPVIPETPAKPVTPKPSFMEKIKAFKSVKKHEEAE